MTRFVMEVADRIPEEQTLILTLVGGIAANESTETLEG